MSVTDGIAWLVSKQITAYRIDLPPGIRATDIPLKALVQKFTFQTHGGRDVCACGQKAFSTVIKTILPINIWEINYTCASYIRRISGIAGIKGEAWRTR